MTARQAASECAEPFWGWPGWGLLGYTLLLGGAQTLWFGLIYGGANLLTEQRAARVRIHLDAELAIPFVPALVVVYMSIYPLFWLAPFVLRQRRTLEALAATLAVVTFVGGLGFLLFPSESAFPTPQEAGVWTGLHRFAKGLALRYNMVPSLHVALSVVCIAAYADRAGSVGRLLLWAWVGAVGVSTVLIHQHHLVDVVAGFALGVVGKWGVFDRLGAVSRSHSSQR